MEIKDSARKRGIPDDDLRHAVRQAVSVVVVTDPTGRSVVMYVGPDRTGKLLEVGLNYDGDAVHAMDARKQFLPGFDRKRGKRRGMR